MSLLDNDADRVNRPAADGHQLKPVLDGTVITPNPGGFDYGSLSSTAAREAQTIAARIRSRKNAFYIETGRDLSTVKKMLGHGAFGKWLRAEFDMSERTARNLMSTAVLVDKSAIFADLPVTTIYRLAAPSTPEIVREEIVAQLEQGDNLSSQGIASAIADGKKREAAKRAEQAKLERRMMDKSPEAQKRLLKYEDRKQRQAELEEKKIKQRTIERDEAATAAVDLLRQHLGPHFPTFIDLYQRSSSWDFQNKLTAMKDNQ